MQKVLEPIQLIQNSLVAMRRKTIARVLDIPALQPLFTLSKKAHNSFKHLRSYFALSLRGLLVLTLSTYCLFYYAIPNSDLSASIISSFLLCLCLLSLLRAALAARKVKKQLEVELIIDDHNLHSRHEIDSGLVLHHLQVPALHRLAVHRVFERKGVQSPTHQIRGTPVYGDTVRLIDTCKFPHRGSWQLDGLEVCLQDFLGFTKFSWLLPQKELIEISAPSSEVRPLPIVAASSQPGDLLQHTENRTGDLFDIKAYDPSDGTKRILWKTYAKSRQLVVRRPEPAMVPEGEVAIFSLAAKEDDHVASAAISYIEQLERNNIQVLFGADSLPAKDYLDFATPCVSGAEAKAALRLDVWNTALGTGQGFSRFIEELENLNKSPRQVIFYIDKDRLAEDGPSAIVNRIAAQSERYRVQPVFVVVDRAFLEPKARLDKLKGEHKKMGSLTPLHGLRSGLKTSKGKTSSKRTSKVNFGSLSTTILEAERAES